MLKPFFPYFGGKFRLAKHYPQPAYELLVEPFAGAAGYAMHYSHHQVRLFDLDENVCAVWDYLIKASTSEIESLPTDVTCLDDLNVCNDAKKLIGFWMAKGHPYPVNKPCSWMASGRYPNQFWGEYIKNRVVAQQPYIRHWQITQSDYKNVPVDRATWFIDPPYIDRCGRRYRHHKVDYFDLRAWVMSLPGQVITCENNGAFWLPFKYLTDANTLTNQKRREVVYLQIS